MILPMTGTTMMIITAMMMIALVEMIKVLMTHYHGIHLLDVLMAASVSDAPRPRAASGPPHGFDWRQHRFPKVCNPKMDKEEAPVIQAWFHPGYGKHLNHPVVFAQFHDQPRQL